MSWAWRLSISTWLAWAPSPICRKWSIKPLPLSSARRFGSFIHGGFCLLGAKLLRVDVHTAAIASAANIGGAASAPVVASHHQESLVPASILMALIGYAIGNFAAYGAALLCRAVS